MTMMGLITAKRANRMLPMTFTITSPITMGAASAATLNATRRAFSAGGSGTATGAGEPGSALRGGRLNGTESRPPTNATSSPTGRSFGSTLTVASLAPNATSAPARTGTECRVACPSIRVPLSEPTSHTSTCDPTHRTLAC